MTFDEFCATKGIAITKNSFKNWIKRHKHHTLARKSYEDWSNIFLREYINQ